MYLRDADRRNNSLGKCALMFVSLTAILTDASGQSPNKNYEWPTYNADLAGSRYRPLDQINAANFGKLEVAWRFKTDSIGNRPEFKLEGTPLMVNGVVYATAGTRRGVIALDAAQVSCYGCMVNMRARGELRLRDNYRAAVWRIGPTAQKNASFMSRLAIAWWHWTPRLARPSKASAPTDWST